MPETIVWAGDYCGRLVLPQALFHIAPATRRAFVLNFELNSRTALAYSSVAFFNSVPRSFAYCAPVFLRASRTSCTFFSAALTSSMVDMAMPLSPSFAVFETHLRLMGANPYHLIRVMPLF